ncbi:MAG: hypothetical protein LBG77_03380 [Dysgonamonadaceae bacterium]|jgi:hypothetical protein|nr:hypothetical protein [Dysgonamonadaceae bacterium]
MIDIALNEKTKRSIERSTGISYATIVDSDALSLDKLLEQKIKKSLSFNYAKRDGRLPARGVRLAIR